VALQHAGENGLVADKSYSIDDESILSFYLTDDESYRNIFHERFALAKVNLEMRTILACRKRMLNKDVEVINVGKFGARNAYVASSFINSNPVWVDNGSMLPSCEIITWQWKRNLI
jgi:hypothetical protein